MGIFKFFRQTRTRNNPYTNRTQLRLEQFEDRTVPATLIVGNTGAFASLQAAIAAAADGDTIIVQTTNTIAEGTGNTGLPADVAAGATDLTVTNAAGFKVGDVVFIDDPDANEDEFKFVTAVDVGLNKLTLSTATAFAHQAAGTNITSAAIGINKDVTITGDPNAVQAGINADLWVVSGTKGVSISHLNINDGNPTEASITVDAGASMTSVNDVTLFNYDENPLNMASTTSGSNTLSNSTIIQTVEIWGNTAGTDTNDVIRNNNIGLGLILRHADGTMVSQNTISSFAGVGVQILGGGEGITLSQNIINGAVAGVMVVQPDAATVVDVNISNNTINTGSAGNGIHLDVFNGVDAGKKFSATVSGNDLRNNLVGLLVTGDAQSADTSAGDVNADNSNNFSSFTENKVASGFLAIALRDTGANDKGSVSAQNNIFASGVDPNKVVQDGDSNEMGMGDGTIDVTALAQAQVPIAKLYVDFLGRVGSPSEYSFWAGQSPSAAASGIANSQEASAFIVDQYYLAILGRSADSGGASFWTGFLQTNSTEAFIAAMLNSQEFFNRAVQIGILPAGVPVTSNSSFVAAAYQTLLGRGASADEINYWVGIIGDRGITGVAQGLVNSLEFRLKVVQAYYNGVNATRLPMPNILERTLTPAPSEISFWAGTTMNIEQIAIALASSPEFFS